MISIISRAIMMGTPLLYGAFSEVISERSGMMNTGIEGAFLMGAWGGFVGTYLTKNIWLGILFAILCSLVTMIIYGIITVYMKQQQIVTGTAINIVTIGFCSFFQRVVFGTPTTPLRIETLDKIAVPVLSKIPIIGEVFFNQNIITYLVYLLIPVVFFVLKNTSLGLIVRSTGENPTAVDVAGINVQRVRFGTLLLSGILCGIAGSFYTVGYLGMFTTSIIGGRGWIAFAICFLGNWTPIGAVLGTLIFGLADSVSIYIQSLGSTGYFPNEVFIALPYILTILLTISRRKFNVPQQLGVPYSKES